MSSQYCCTLGPCTCLIHTLHMTSPYKFSATQALIFIITFIFNAIEYIYIYIYLPKNLLPML